MTSRVALSALLTLTSGVYAVSVGVPQAQAATGSDGCNPTVSGGTSGGGATNNDGVISVWATLTEGSKNDLCPGLSSFQPAKPLPPLPPCWWEPEFSPSQLAGAIAQYSPSSSEQTYTDYTGQYASTGINGAYSTGYSPTQGPKPPWERFNEGYENDGTWWGLFYNEESTSGFAQCTTIFDDVYPENWFWVADNAAANPPAGTPLTAEWLAYYVAGKVKLIPITVQSNPNLSSKTKATVGLPTWLWADGGTNTVVKDNICTDQQHGNICVYLTALATGYTIVTGDPAAKVYSACKANAAGDIGTAYSGGTGKPPCGITFGTPGTWQISLVTTWNVTVSWNPAVRPDEVVIPAQTETDLTAVVQAVQAINY